MAGYEYIEVSDEHPWDPNNKKMPPVMPESEREPEPEDPHHRREKRWGSSNAWMTFATGAEASHRPHYCYIPGLHLLLVQVFFFGLDQEQFFINKVG